VRLVDAFAEWVRAAYGLGPAPVFLTYVGRGADAKVWLLECAGQRYAVKRPFEALDEDRLCREAAFVEGFACAGIEVPLGVRDTTGRYAASLPEFLGGGHVRLTQWVEGEPVPTPATGLAGPIGTLIGRLHAAAPPTDEAPGPWYTTVPPPTTWDELARRCAHEPWGARLVRRSPSLLWLSELARHAGPPHRLVTSHRDLHPQNVLVTPGGTLAALDWEDVGPTDPDRELAKLLVQWHVQLHVVDEDAVRETLSAYRAAGGTGAVVDTDAFATVICTELNFLASQLRAATAVGCLADNRHHMTGEIEEALAYLPSVAALRRVVEVATRG
jgi:aminoglycoside phosphotransferase (APT) family kinase protein